MTDQHSAKRQYPPHTAKRVVVHCMDDRLQGSLEPHVVGSTGSAFRVSVAGGPAAFVWRESRAVMIDQIMAAYAINRIGQIDLVAHPDCGAYRRKGIRFADFNAEVAGLYADLNRAAAIIWQAFVDAGVDLRTIKIRCLAVELDGRRV